MSHWNHRVIRRYDKKTDTTTFQVHEVFYDDNNKIDGWSECPVEPMGETISELKNELKYFMKALDEPILEEKLESGKHYLVEINVSDR